MFSTHYHMLLDEFENFPGVTNYHMAFKADETSEQQKVIFLYNFIKGKCPASFGLNVARMAGLPSQVLDRAKTKASIFAY